MFIYLQMRFVDQVSVIFIALSGAFEVVTGARDQRGFWTRAAAPLRRLSAENRGADSSSAAIDRTRPCYNKGWKR